MSGPNGAPAPPLSAAAAPACRSCGGSGCGGGPPRPRPAAGARRFDTPTCPAATASTSGARRRALGAAQDRARAERRHQHLHHRRRAVAGDHDVAAVRAPAAPGSASARVAAGAVDHHVERAVRPGLLEGIALGVVEHHVGAEPAHQLGVLAGAHARRPGRRGTSAWRSAPRTGRRRPTRRAPARAGPARCGRYSCIAIHAVTPATGSAPATSNGTSSGSGGDLVGAHHHGVGVAAVLAAREVGAADDPLRRRRGRCTRAPTASTTPAKSTPRITGPRGPRNEADQARRQPQRPAARIFQSTGLTPIAWTGDPHLARPRLRRGELRRAPSARRTSRIASPWRTWCGAACQGERGPSMPAAVAGAWPPGPRRCTVNVGAARRVFVSNGPCADIRALETIKHAAHRRCNDRQNRGPLGSPAHLPDVRRHAVLRQLAQPARQPPRRPRQATRWSPRPEPGERWLYCYPDDALRGVLIPGLRRRSTGLARGARTWSRTDMGQPRRAAGSGRPAPTAVRCSLAPLPLGPELDAEPVGQAADLRVARCRRARAITQTLPRCSAARAAKRSSSRAPPAAAAALGGRRRTTGGRCSEADLVAAGDREGGRQSVARARGCSAARSRRTARAPRCGGQRAARGPPAASAAAARRPAARCPRGARAAAAGGADAAQAGEQVARGSCPRRPAAARSRGSRRPRGRPRRPAGSRPSGITSRSCSTRSSAGLGRPGSSRDLVEEQGPAVGGAHQPEAVVAGAREGALAGAEQLALDKWSGSAPQLTATNGAAPARARRGSPAPRPPCRCRSRRASSTGTAVARHPRQDVRARARARADRVRNPPGSAPRRAPGAACGRGPGRSRKSAVPDLEESRSPTTWRCGRRARR